MKDKTYEELCDEEFEKFSIFLDSLNSEQFKLYRKYWEAMRERELKGKDL